jgi:hypothetical protein
MLSMIILLREMSLEAVLSLEYHVADSFHKGQESGDWK